MDNILEQLDEALKEYEAVRDMLGRANAPRTDLIRVYARLESALERLSPVNSAYRRALGSLGGTLSDRIRSAAGRLRSLREEYAAGYLKTIEELIHAETFSHLLDSAKYLIDSGYKDAGAVIVGSVLEQRLRDLSTKYGIQTVDTNKRPRKAEALNQELASNGIYNLLNQKSVTAWLDLRNNAAHGHFNEYDAKQASSVLESVSDFMARFPA